MKKNRFFICLLILGLLLMSCQKKLSYKPLEGILQDAVADSAWPGGVMMIAQNNDIKFHQSFGYHTYRQREKTQKNDIFDLASISKVIGTTSAVMKLVETGQLDLNEKAVHYLPELAGPDEKTTEWKNAITVNHLLTHTAGFPPFLLFYEMDTDIQTRWDSVFNCPMDNPPGTKTVYSDIGLMLVGKIVESISGMCMDQYLYQEVFHPLGMYHTYYNPPVSLMKHIVPTEITDLEKGLIRGFVHDENSHSLGGVTGHAGLFSTTEDLGRFCQMMLNEGVLDSVRIFKPETITKFTTPINKTSSRCLGWDSPEGESSAGIYASPRSFGHTGYTGTSLWIDPENQLYVILLTNAVHPNRKYKYPNYFDWRQLVHSSAYERLGLTKLNKKVDLKERWQ